MSSQNRSGRPWPVLEAVAMLLALLVGWRLAVLGPGWHAPHAAAPLCQTHCQARLGGGFGTRLVASVPRSAYRSVPLPAHGPGLSGPAGLPGGETGFPARDDRLYTTDARAL